jgi:CDP-glycerol glycerophosphotransferase (TagB/SpsB family)
VLRRLKSYARVLIGNLILHRLSRILRRDPELWAFGAPEGRFEGNSKYVFLWLSLQRSPVSTVWITRKRRLARELRARGLVSYFRWSPRGIHAAARAAVYIVNDNSSDINFNLSGGAKIFNLWHGVGLKNVRFGAQVGSGAVLRSKPQNSFWKIRNMRRFETPDWILATSPEMAEEFFARCFQVPLTRAPALGYPRLDVALDEELRQLGGSFQNNSVIKGQGFARKLLYGPTLRAEGADFLANALPDLPRLSEALRKQQSELFIKIHPKMAHRTRVDGGLPDNIVILPPDFDIYPFLHSFDALITDYSSIFFDYIYARSNGVLLYTFDLKEYKATERDLAWDYDQATIGVRADNFTALCEILADGRIFDALEPEKLAKLRERFWGGEPRLPTASEKVVDFLISRIALR